MKLFTKDNYGTSFFKLGSDRNVCASRLIKSRDVFHFSNIILIVVSDISWGVFLPNTDTKRLNILDWTNTLAYFASTPMKKAKMLIKLITF